MRESDGRHGVYWVVCRLARKVEVGAFFLQVAEVNYEHLPQLWGSIGKPTIRRLLPTDSNIRKGPRLG